MKNEYGSELVVVILLPVLVSLIGGMLITGGWQQFSAYDANQFFSWFHIYITGSLLVSLIALFMHYLKNKYGYIINLIYILSVGVIADLALGKDVKLYHYIVPLFAFTIMTHLLVVKVFYKPALVRARTLLFGLGLALALTLSYRLLFVMLNKAVEPGFWLSYYTFFLYLAIFVGFGLSFADLIVVKASYKRYLQTHPQKPDEDEEDEDEDIDAQR